MKEVLIVGDGPAGISASLYTARAGYSTLVVALGKSALEKAEKIDNFYGAPGLTGAELHKRGIEQAKALGVEFAEDEIFSLQPVTGGFSAVGKKSEYEAKTILLALGSPRFKPPIKNLADFEGAGVSYCVVCDGFFFRGKSVALLGNGDFALHELADLKNFTDKITVLTNGEKANPAFEKLGINIREEKIDEVAGDDRLSHLIFANGEKLEIDGLFIALGTAGALELARKTGLELAENAIAIDAEGRTSLPGIFAAGDCTGDVKQIAVAVAQGAKAGLAIVRHLRA